MLFNAGCNEQVLRLNTENKKIAQISLVVFEKNATNAYFNSEK